jgi:hypothetical protein
MLRHDENYPFNDNHIFPQLGCGIRNLSQNKTRANHQAPGAPLGVISPLDY